MSLSLRQCFAACALLTVLGPEVALAQPPATADNAASDDNTSAADNTASPPDASCVLPDRTAAAVVAPPARAPQHIRIGSAFRSNRRVAMFTAGELHALLQNVGAPAPTERAATTDDEPGRHVPYATLLLSAYLGQLAGIAAGALLGALGAAISGCDNGEGWVGGYTCFAGYGYAASLGGLIAMPFGTTIGLAIASDAMRLPIDGAGAALGAGLGMLPGALGPLSYLFEGQLSLMFLLSYLIPLGISPLLATTYATDSLHGRADFAIAPYARPALAGAELGVSGRF